MVVIACKRQNTDVYFEHCSAFPQITGQGKTRTWVLNGWTSRCQFAHK